MARHCRAFDRAVAGGGRRPQCWMPSDVVERRAVANRGHPRRSTLSDIAKRRVKGQWQAGEASSALNVK